MKGLNEPLKKPKLVKKKPKHPRKSFSNLWESLNNL
jgi:hypothetical protein